MRLRVVINERGNIVGTNVVSGNPLLVPSAIALVKRFHIVPSVVGESMFQLPQK